MFHSNAGSSLLLLAVSPEDAADWQATYPELALAVRVVMVGKHRDSLEGRHVTAVYATGLCEFHADYSHTLGAATRQLAFTPPFVGPVRVA